MNTFRPMPAVEFFRCCRFVLLFMALVAIPWLRTGAQQPGVGQELQSTPLSAEQVVDNLVRMNRQRSEALEAFKGIRTYQVKYSGFPGTRSASMVVEAKYRSPGSKDLTILSATGSKLIIEKVFKKLLEAEKEAQRPEVQLQTALNRDNYAFTLLQYEADFSGSTYVLGVEPRRKDKLLYRGRIWVNAEEFAVVRLEAEPAKNPSFWTRNSKIVQVYSKVRDFWLPAYNESASDVRLGGHAELTIQYENYEVKGNTSVANLSNTAVTQQTVNPAIEGEWQQNDADGTQRLERHILKLGVGKTWNTHNQRESRQNWE